MNIFYLSTNADECARYHCDKHVVKMILETAQMLSTAHRVLDGDELADEKKLYKKVHVNHPSTKWVRKSYANYLWAYDLLYSLCKEYTFRYNKYHKVQRSGLLTMLMAVPDAFGTDHWKFHILVDSHTAPPMCMPDQYKVEGDPVAAYRRYYKGEKAYFARWDRGRASPEWWDDDMQDLVQHFATTEEMLNSVEDKSWHTQ